MPNPKDAGCCMEDKNLHHIETLLAQSMNGLHLLFDHDRVAEILKVPTEELDFFKNENMEKIQALFSEFMEKSSLHEKKSFLSSLDPHSFEILVRTYFHILDNSLLAASSVKH